MGKKILVVDDSATVRQQVALALGEAGFDVLEAVDGQDGLDKIKATPALSAVICDINMPRMNGLEMIEKVRAQSALSSLPVIMLTTEGQPSLIARAKQAGAKAWIIKPFKAELLVSALRKVAA